MRWQREIGVNWLIDSLRERLPRSEWEVTAVDRNQSSLFFLERDCFVDLRNVEFFFGVQIQLLGKNSETNWWIFCHRCKLSASISYCKYFCIFYYFYTLFIKSVKKYKHRTKSSLFSQTIFSFVVRRPNILLNYLYSKIVSRIISNKSIV